MKTLDSEMWALHGQVQIYLDHSHNWSEEIQQHHRKVLKSAYKRILELPINEFSHNAWDTTIQALDDAGIMPPWVPEND